MADNTLATSHLEESCMFSRSVLGSHGVFFVKHPVDSRDSSDQTNRRN